MIQIYVNDAPFSGVVFNEYISGSQIDIQIGNDNDEAIINFMPLSAEGEEESIEMYLSKSLVFSLYEMIKGQEKRKLDHENAFKRNVEVNEVF